MKDLSVCNDFFNYAFLKNDFDKLHLKYDHAIAILPLIITLINSKYDIYFKNGVKTAWVILKLYYDVKYLLFIIIKIYIKFIQTIIQAKNTPVVGGVDLAREDKLKKFDTILEFFEKIRVLENVERNLKKEKHDEVFFLFTI
jgi:hypothetical protein